MAVIRCRFQPVFLLRVFSAPERCLCPSVCQYRKLLLAGDICFRGLAKYGELRFTLAFSSLWQRTTPLRDTDGHLAQWVFCHNGNIVKAMLGFDMAIADRLPLFDWFIEVG
jgi:hypothetical protein